MTSYMYNMNINSFHRDWVMHICVSKLSHHWFTQWLATCSVPSHYLNSAGFIVNWVQISLQFQSNKKQYIWKFSQQSHSHFVWSPCVNLTVKAWFIHFLLTSGSVIWFVSISSLPKANSRLEWNHKLASQSSYGILTAAVSLKIAALYHCSFHCQAVAMHKVLELLYNPKWCKKRNVNMIFGYSFFLVVICQQLMDLCDIYWPIFILGCFTAWWSHQMETISALLGICEWNPPVTVGFPSQRPMMRSLDVFFDLCLNKQWSKQSRCQRFETPSHSLWHQCNGNHRNNKTVPVPVKQP